MSTKNNPDFRLVTGNMLERDMTTLTYEQLEHEHALAYEILHGIYSNFPPYYGGLAIKGLLMELADNPDKSDNELFMTALNVWQTRLERAENELERRFLLS